MDRVESFAHLSMRPFVGRLPIQSQACQRRLRRTGGRKLPNLLGMPFEYAQRDIAQVA